MGDSAQDHERDLTLTIPGNLTRHLSVGGAHRRGLKVLAWGEAGAGKSYFLAHFPSPKVVIDCGEGGIQPMLSPDRSVDIPFTVIEPQHFLEVIEFVLANEKKLASVVIDPLSVLWEDWMDSWSAKLGGDIRGGDWRLVKGPWKVFMRQLMRSHMHVGFSAWMRDLIYEQADAPRGERGALQIRPQEVPQTEKRVPHHIDLALQWYIGRDQKNRPTTQHHAKVSKARRPRSIDPKDLHIGKEWTFDELNPVDPWKAIIEPLLVNWDEGAVDYLGVDPREASLEMEQLEDAAHDQEVGRILRLIDKPYKTLDQYKRVWDEEIEPAVELMGAKHRQTILPAHTKKKDELMKGGK